MTAGFYRKPSGNAPNAWPSYWEGRWFVADYAGANNIRHAMLMDPATESTGGLPVAADSLYGIIPTALMGGNRMIDLDFGPDGALYVADYGGSNFAINNNNNSVRRFAYVGGADTPGPDPKVAPNANPASTTFSFNKGMSGGISYKWDFSDGGTATGENVTHTYVSAGNGVRPSATLTVTYADGQTSSATIDVPVPTTVPHGQLDRAADPRSDDRRAGQLRRLRAGRHQHVRRQHHGQRHLDDAERAAHRHRPERDERRVPGQRRRRRWRRVCGCGRRTRRTPNTAFNEHHGNPVEPALLERPGQ